MKSTLKTKAKWHNTIPLEITDGPSSNLASLLQFVIEDTYRDHEPPSDDQIYLCRELDLCVVSITCKKALCT
jgi:hypothetical protein